MYRTLPDNIEEDSDVPQQPSLSFSQDCTSPGPVDNSELFKQGTSNLKAKLKELKDFVILPEGVWCYLLSWYGLVSGKTTL
jgi:DUSP domain